MKKFTLRRYLFSILALFLCINLAQALPLPDQMFECIVPAKSDNINYKVQWLASKGNVYSTFGRALDYAPDASSNLSRLTNFTDGHSDYSNYWSIKVDTKLIGGTTWDIIFVSDGTPVIDAKNLKCKKSPTFDQALATQVATFFNNDEKTEDHLSPWHLTNPIRLVDVNAHNLQVAEDNFCSVEITERKVGEKTELLPKKRCCDKALKTCAIL